MALQWTQAPIFSARGMTGTYYKVFPFSNSDQFAAVATYLDQGGNPITQPIGGQFASVEEAKAACEKEMARASTPAKA